MTRQYLDRQGDRTAKLTCEFVPGTIVQYLLVRGGDRSFVFMPVKRLDYAHVVQMQYQKDMEATAGSLGDSV